MDNKLSELSKPVGFVSECASTQLKDGDPASIRPFFDVQGSSPLYSQEYVSALLAELEVVKAENALFRETGDYLIQAAYCAQERATAAEAKLEASRKINAFLKEQLSQLANFNPDWDMLEACRESCREISAALKEAETRLATPVRLPNESAASAMFDIFYQTERNNYRNVQLGFSDAKALGEWIAKELKLRGAGFKCVGDE